MEEWISSFEKLYCFQGEYFDDSYKDEIHKGAVDVEVNDKLNQNLNKQITLHEVRHAGESAKCKKALGIDKIANELLKCEESIKLLYVLFKTIMSSGLVLSQWSMAIIFPIPKESGYVIDPTKYRGLALQCCIYKVLSSILNTRLVTLLEEKHLIEDKQNGFRKGQSCQQHIFVLTSLVQKCLSQGSSLHTIFVDFHKAFDVIDRDLLFHTLEKHGIGGLFLHVLKEMYKNTINMVKVNHLFTSEFNSNQGVQQGDNLSPMLFSEFINRLLKELQTLDMGVELKNGQKICVLAYADDIVLLE